MSDISILNESIELAKNIEKKGMGKEAVEVLIAMVKNCKEIPLECQIEKANLELRNGFLKEALIDFITVYQATESKEVLLFILDLYFGKDDGRYMDQFWLNIQKFKQYPYIFGGLPKSLSIFILWVDDEDIVLYDERVEKFTICHNDIMVLEKQIEQTFLLCNMMFFDKIEMCERCSVVRWSINNRTLPIYMLLEDQYLQGLLQLVDFAEIFEKKRWVLFTDPKAMSDYFWKEMVVFPNYVIGEKNTSGKYEIMMDSIIKEREQQRIENEKKIYAYYKNNKESIIVRIREQHPRMLFYTSRFTTALQYHMKNCEHAAKKLGLETRLLIEENEITYLCARDLVNAIADFLPDILVMIDHFRFEADIIPDELVCLSWIQDEMPVIMDPGSADKLIETDVLINYMINETEIVELYRNKHMIPGPIPANEDIYKPYNLSYDEYKMYECDICFVCHASDPEYYIEEVKRRYTEDWIKKEIEKLYSDYLALAYDYGVFYKKQEFENYIIKKAPRLGLVENNETGKEILKDMFFAYNQRVYRQILVEWIIEAGFTKIKLWGNGWERNPKFAPYAMGVAENGEILSKILQASKISVGNNIMLTSAARTWETMLSGGFYLANYLPPEDDVCDMRNIIDEDVIVMFNGRCDLIEKLHFYLENDIEREEMSKRQREEALDKMTFLSFMKKVLHEIPDILEKQSKEDGKYDVGQR